MRTLSVSTLLLALAATAAAQPQSLVNQFERRSIESSGLAVSYALFVPENYDPSVSYPLVMALHGAGERGSNLVNIERHRLATAWADPAVQAEHPAFVLAPQVPSGLRWTSDADPDDTDFVSIELATLDILDVVEGEFSIDPDRVYVVGLSLGGHGTWDFISRLPGRFAAAVPMSGRAFVSQADDILHIPIWAFTGETDTVVPSSQTRRVIQAMEDLGRDVIYTHCRRSPVDARAFDCPGSIGLDSLEAAIDARADLVYTSEATVGHGPWAPWFDHPLLADWLFSKVRRDTDAITITAPTASARATGTTTVTWTSLRTTSDTVEVWLSIDGSFGGEKLGEVPIADGAFSFDTAAFPDAALAEVRLFVRNEDGRIAGRATSGRFAIDNPGNAAPDLRLDAEDLRFDPRLVATSYDLTLTAADPEDDALTARVFYSADGGTTFALVATETLTSSVDPQTISLDVEGLPNTRTARFRMDIDDGTATTSATTAVFLKQTPREGGQTGEQVEGEGVGSVELHVIDRDALTGHRYRITFDTSGETKTYSVTDLDENETVLSGVPLSDGLEESPVFDGLALVVQDLVEGMADLDQTGWVEGDSELGVAVSGGSVRISILTIDLLATETDYEITMTDAIAGQSIELFRIPVQDLRFTVTGDDGLERDVVFDDKNDDGRPGDGDVLYIVEPDAENEPALAWKLEFSATSTTELPETGDVFRLVPVRSLGTDDVFEFTASFGVAAEDGPGAAAIEVAVYPNPFAGQATVAYRLDEPAIVTLEVFDALGRRIATLAEGPIDSGEHRATWAGEAASGVFFVRFTARPLAGGPAQVVRQSVVRVVR